jgi:8-oxo-dGTP pyrophosphatase MutT (NUDIX family)
MLIEDKSYGVLLILKGEENRILILKQINGHWSFPKGHGEVGENERESALRELEEETGIQEIEFADLPNLFERYPFQKDGKDYQKINEFFIAFAFNDSVRMQESEVLEYKWATFEEALSTFTYEEPKRVIGLLQESLINI